MSEYCDECGIKHLHLIDGRCPKCYGRWLEWQRIEIRATPAQFMPWLENIVSESNPPLYLAPRINTTLFAPKGWLLHVTPITLYQAVVEGYYFADAATFRAITDPAAFKAIMDIRPEFFLSAPGGTVIEFQLSPTDHHTTVIKSRCDREELRPYYYELLGAIRADWLSSGEWATESDPNTKLAKLTKMRQTARKRCEQAHRLITEERTPPSEACRIAGTHFNTYKKWKDWDGPFHLVSEMELS